MSEYISSKCAMFTIIKSKDKTKKNIFKNCNRKRKNIERELQRAKKITPDSGLKIRGC